MKKIFWVLLVSLAFYSCKDNSNNPLPEEQISGSIILTSTPPGASIYLLGTKLTNTTPDTIKGLSEGTYSFKLEKEDYVDTTFDVIVKKNLTASKDVVMKKELKYTLYNTNTCNINTNLIYSIHQDSSGAMWFGTDKGLSKLSNGTWTNYISTYAVLEIVKFSSKGIYLRSTERIGLFASSQFKWSDNFSQVRAMMVSNKDSVYIVRFNGVIKVFGTEQYPFNQSVNEISSNSSFLINQNSNMTTGFVDRLSRIILIQVEGNIVRRNINYSFESLGSAGGNITENKIAEDLDGTLWIANEKGCFKTVGNTTAKIFATAVHFVTSSNNIVLFGSNNGVLDKSGNVIFNTQNSTLPSNYIASIFIAKENTIWVAAHGGGVLKIWGWL